MLNRVITLADQTYKHIVLGFWRYDPFVGWTHAIALLVLVVVFGCYRIQRAGEKRARQEWIWWLLLAACCFILLRERL
jgi:uncharacterized BrkB/YihY/UPF0761 family membrane protein